MENVVVHAERGRFAGWPANNGVWVWNGTEILVGFTVGDFEERKGHNIREPYTCMLARSVDGGYTWTTEQPGNFVGRGGTLETVSGPLDLVNPGLAIRIVGTGYHGSENPQGCFYHSNDRGINWDGPFALQGLPDDGVLKGKDLTSRTDYLVTNSHDCLFFMSAREPGNWADEKVLCVRTTDGCRTFRFMSWVVGSSDPFRAVMPSTVRCASSRLVSAIRRREIGTDDCWIDVYNSTDNGCRWSFLSRVTNTGPQNGNPPSLVRFNKTRLCCVYGNRADLRIEARYSEDEGRTWGDSIILRADYRADAYGTADLGYPRVVCRADGKLVAIYYWATEDRPVQHIAATIWDPDL